ncbi:Nitrogenase iron-iron protein alpha chain [Hydrogenophaga sp. T4]|nr:Nitrogenase iron-iron protein alpha chain [Hydrogenophaga sp. T4]
MKQGADAELIERTERLIEVEEARAYKRIAEYKKRLQGKRVLLITGGVKSWSVVAALQEGGMEIVGTSVKKSTKEDKEKIKEIMGEGADAHMIDDMTPREMYAMLKEARADIMLSGGRSQFVALKARMPWLDINQERHHPYGGYEAWSSWCTKSTAPSSTGVAAGAHSRAWGDDGETLGAVTPTVTGTSTDHLSAVAANAMGLEPEEIPV